MKILLTGGTGFIGSHTAVEMLKAGYEPVLADNLSNSRAETAELIGRITGTTPKLYILDLQDKAALTGLFEAEKPAAVVHFAGFKAVGESVARPLMYYRNNLDSTLTLLEVMREQDCRRIIFSSSATVYGDLSEPPFTEESPTGGCTNPYGETKLMIERILQDTAGAWPELSAVLLRYFNPIGAHESGLIGERPSGIPNNLMPYVTQVAAGLRGQLSVYGSDYPTPDGTGVRDYIHVVDLARGHVAALGYALEHRGCEVFNLGTGRGSSVLDIIRTFEQVNRVPIPYVLAPRRPGDVAESYASPDKAREMLGWQAQKSLADMCRDAWRFQQNNKE